MSAGGEARTTPATTAASARFGSSLGNVADGVLRDVMTSALPYRADGVNGEEGGV